MDVRLKKEESNVSEMQNDKLTDSLIYNIIKKIELRMTMEEKYEENRLPQLKAIPNQLGRYLHSTTAMGYFGIAMCSILYLRFKSKMSLSFKSFIPHAIIAISINQYERYSKIMSVDEEMRNEFRSFQANTRSIINQKKERLSLSSEISKMNLISCEKLLQMIKYKPLY